MFEYKLKFNFQLLIFSSAMFFKLDFLDLFIIFH